MTKNLRIFSFTVSGSSAAVLHQIRAPLVGVFYLEWVQRLSNSRPLWSRVKNACGISRGNLPDKWMLVNLLMLAVRRTKVVYLANYVIATKQTTKSRDIRAPKRGRRQLWSVARTYNITSAFLAGFSEQGNRIVWWCLPASCSPNSIKTSTYSIRHTFYGLLSRRRYAYGPWANDSYGQS